MTEITDADKVVEPSSEKANGPVKQFFLKTSIVTAAVAVLVMFSTWCVTSSIQDLADLPAIKGGPVFWGIIENKLYKLADEPDLPTQKKEKIIKALSKLSARYHPYLEALFQPPAKPQLPATEK